MRCVICGTEFDINSKLRDARDPECCNKWCEKEKADREYYGADYVKDKSE